MSATDSSHDLGQLSLGRLTWRRMLGHRPACLALVLVVTVTLLSFGANHCAPHDPTETRPWLRVRPPGSRAPAVAAVNRFAPGEPPRTSPRLATAATVVLDTVEWRAATDYRITPRAGRIARIQAAVGMTMLEELDLGSRLAFVLDEDGQPGQRHEGVHLRVGDPLPEDLAVAPGRSLLLRTVDPEDIRSYRFTITLAADGVVDTITRDGHPFDGDLRLPAPLITAASADGQPVTLRFWLGSDALGRDLFSRVLYGGRISLTVGLVATLVSVVIGVLYGAVSGWLGGRADRLMMGAIDVLYAIPFLFLVIILLVVFGRNAIVLFAALGAVQWLTTARIVRGQVLSLKHRAFIEAARLSGASGARIVLRHLIPNCLGPIIVYSTLTVPAVILEESFLAFIGLRVEWGGQALDSWGALVREGAQVMDLQPWLLLVPAAVMSATLLAMNVAGDALRDAVDPQLQERRR